LLRIANLVDYNRALSNFRSAAKKGSVVALRELGLIYLKGLTPSASSSREATSSVEENTSPSEASVVEKSDGKETVKEEGVAYVVKPDFDAAVKLFKEGALKRDLGCA
jgi:TPR repeat protein